MFQDRGSTCENGGYASENYSIHFDAEPLNVVTKICRRVIISCYRLKQMMTFCWTNIEQTTFKRKCCGFRLWLHAEIEDKHLFRYALSIF